jgi:hypothetical protein
MVNVYKTANNAKKAINVSNVEMITDYKKKIMETLSVIPIPHLQKVIIKTLKLIFMKNV